METIPFVAATADQRKTVKDLNFSTHKQCDYLAGWELFDPFVPVEVPAFSQGELDVMIDYCVDMK